MQIYVNGEYREATEEELREYLEQFGEAVQTPEERIAALEEQNAMLTECILELSEILYA